MDYRESREYINEISKYGSVLGLDNILKLLEYLDNPQDKLQIVHFAGTNGKGSTIAYTESILKVAGYKVGKYTSPAVFHEREIYQINSEYIPEEDYARNMTIIKKAADIMVSEGFAHPTPFEIETAMAFLYFYNEKCEVVLLETGMGGETDATNVVKQVLCSVITSISLDHMNFLGETIEEITKVKAGIIKEKCPVVVSRQSERATEVIRKVADSRDSYLVVPGMTTNVRVDGDMCTVFDYECSSIDNDSFRRVQGKDKTELDKVSFCDLKVSMLGGFQPGNAATAIEVARVLETQGYKLYESIREGLLKAKVGGRFELVSKSPVVIIDGAHNPGAAEELKASLEMYFTNRKIAYIMGVLADKNYHKVAEITAPLAQSIITITPDNPRALESDKLCDAVSRYNTNVVAVSSVEEAVAESVTKVQNGMADVIVAFGSLSYLGEVRSVLAQIIGQEDV